jgi:hypothetical protein
LGAKLTEKKRLSPQGKIAVIPHFFYGLAEPPRKNASSPQEVETSSAVLPYPANLESAIAVAVCVAGLDSSEVEMGIRYLG